MEPEADLTPSSPAVRPAWPRRLTLALLWLGLCLGSGELAARAFWRLRFHVPIRHPSRILYALYPELRYVAVTRPAHGDGFYNVLLLGGSTLHRDWGPVAQALAEQLAEAGHRNVRIISLAMPAHTSRDSRLKYAALGEARFDLVLLYDGINDARANNAPPGLFREDYGHYSWYALANTLAAYHGSASFALPYTVHYLMISMNQALHRDRYVPTLPRPDWTQYGRDNRSAVAFRHNLEAILELASARQDRIVLMTFATYVPEDYSLRAFEEKRLDYVMHYKPIEDWGRREYVLKAVAAQNDIVRSLAAEHPGVLLVDQAKLMAASPLYFNDPCHLTVAGASRFAANVVTALLAEPPDTEKAPRPQ